MSDCSGADVGIMALKALGFRVVHASSCDNAAGPMKWTMRNFQPTMFMHDLLCRDLGKHEAALRDVPCYIAGFPCTPFSMLHNRTKLMKDPNARQFLAVVGAIKQLQPKVIVLENVRGILRCWRRVERHLTSCGPYFFHRVGLGPEVLGCNMTRARIYIVMVHKSVLRESLDNMARFQRFVDLKVACVKSAFARTGQAIPWKELMFDNSHEVVQNMPLPRPEPCQCRCSSCKGGGVATSVGADLSAHPGDSPCKWRQKHWEYMRENALDPKEVVGAFSSRFPHIRLPSLWQNHMCDIIVAQHERNGTPCPEVWDISQSIGRNGAKGTGSAIGCITSDPQKLQARIAGMRALSSHEKCLVRPDT